MGGKPEVPFTILNSVFQGFIGHRFLSSVIRPMNSPLPEKDKCVRSRRACRCVVLSEELGRKPPLFPTRGKSGSAVKIYSYNGHLKINDIALLVWLFLLLHGPSTRALLFPSLRSPSFSLAFSICPVSTGQKREVEVMYGYNPLCTAKKINLNEVIYYLWQVFRTQHCLSKQVLIDFPYLPCQPVDCHCSQPWRNSLRWQGVLPARALCCRA